MNAYNETMAEQMYCPDYNEEMSVSEFIEDYATSIVFGDDVNTYTFKDSSVLVWDIKLDRVRFK